MKTLDKEKLIENSIAFVKKTLQNAEGGHDWFHVERVYRNSLLIAKEEKCDLLVVSLGALLHDIADSKFHSGNETIGQQVARTFLKREKTPGHVTEHIIQIIKNISFKGGNIISTFHSLELDIVQDADRLDAIGAIGVARAFNYGGFKNRKLYDPAIVPNTNLTKDEYKKSTAPTINHFYEKLLLLKDTMNTETGKRLAQKRHDFMVQFLNQFYAEWNGSI